MKKVKFYFIAMMAIVSCGMFTSCDRDVEEAMILSGEWVGDFGMNYTDRFGRTYSCYDTNLRFYQNNSYSRSGWGQQVDFYYDEDPYYTGRHDHRYLLMKQYYRFEWTVSNGVIHLRYPYNPNLDIDIYDYRLNSRYFDGYIGDGRTRFSLDKLADFGWDEYNGYGNFYEWDYWGSWSKKNDITDIDTENKTSATVENAGNGVTWNRFK